MAIKRNIKRSVAATSIGSPDPRTWDAEYKKMMHDLEGLRADHKKLRKLLKEMNRNMKKGQPKKKGDKKRK